MSDYLREDLAADSVMVKVTYEILSMLHVDIDRAHNRTVKDTGVELLHHTSIFRGLG